MVDEGEGVKTTENKIHRPRWNVFSFYILAEWNYLYLSIGYSAASNTVLLYKMFKMHASMHDMLLRCLSVCLSCYQRCLLYGIQKEIQWPSTSYSTKLTVFELYLYASLFATGTNLSHCDYCTLQMKGRWEFNINVWVPLMYSQNWNCYFQNRIIMFCLPVPTFIYLWQIYMYIFLGAICLFCCSTDPGNI